MNRVLLAAWFAFIAGAASAADLAPVYRKAPVAPVASWTGFYAGLNAGYGFNDPTVTTVGSDPISNLIVGLAGGFPQVSYGMNGVIGGGQIGYNWQTAPNWVVGLEADFQGANLSGSGSGQIPSLIVGPSGFLNAAQDLKWFGTVRGRVGYLANDRLMIFGTGGLAYGEAKDSLAVGYNIPIANNAAIGGFAVNCTATNNCYNGSNSKIQVGYSVGGGLEYAAWQNATLKVEYIYVNLGQSNLTSISNPSPAGLLPGILNSHFTDLYLNVVRAGVNWRF